MVPSRDLLPDLVIVFQSEHWVFNSAFPYVQVSDCIYSCDPAFSIEVENIEHPTISRTHTITSSMNALSPMVSCIRGSENDSFRHDVGPARVFTSGKPRPYPSPVYGSPRKNRLSTGTRLSHTWIFVMVISNMRAC